jgi:hypothetical protein
MISTPEEFVRLRTSDDMAEQRAAARLEATVDTWIQIIERYPDMRFWVAQNKTVPIAVLQVLASDSDDRVRFMVAMKRKLPTGLLHEMASDEDEGVRSQVARNRNTALDTLRELLQDPSPAVREVAEAAMSSRVGDAGT